MWDIVLTEAKDHIKSLKPFGIEAKQIAELETAVEAFGKELGTTRDAVADRKVATKKIRELFAVMDDVIRNKFDLLMEQFEGTDFYSRYTKARKLNAAIRNAKEATSTPACGRVRIRIVERKLMYFGKIPVSRSCYFIFILCLNGVD